MGDRGKEAKKGAGYTDKIDRKKDVPIREDQRIEKMTAPDPWPDPPREDGDKGDKKK